MTQRYEIQPCASPHCDATVTMHGARLARRITDLEAQLEMSVALADVAQKASAVSMELVSALQSRIATLETEVSCKAGLLDNLGKDASGKLSNYKWRIAELEALIDRITCKMNAYRKARSPAAEDPLGSALDSIEAWAHELKTGKW